MINKVYLVGSLGKDPQKRETGSGTAVANFSLATTENFKNKEGKYEKKTEWHNIVVWGKLASLCADKLRKGSKALVEGKLQTRSWEKDGTKHYTTEVVAEKVLFLTEKEEEETEAPDIF